MTSDQGTNPAMGRLCGLAEMIAQGAGLEDTLDHIYDSFQDIIPFDRIGYAEVDEFCVNATARWARSQGMTRLRTGYSAKLANSSLSLVITHRMPRILNDLPTYLERHPESVSTQLIVKEGIQSSLTCPMFAGGIPTGFLFFSSRQRDSYTNNHARLLREVTGLISVSLLASQLMDFCKEDECESNLESGGLGPSVLLRRMRRSPVDPANPVSPISLVSHVSPPRLNRPVADPVGPARPRAAPPYSSVSLPITSLTPRMTVARSIRRTDGMLLLSEGACLTQHWIDRLAKMYDCGEIEHWKIPVQR